MPAPRPPAAVPRTPAAPRPAAPRLASLSGRALSVAVAGGAAVAFVLVSAGLVGAGLAASAVGALTALAAGLFVAREALTLRVEAPLRALGLAAAVGVAAITAWPVVTTLAPGSPAFSAELGEVGARAPLPAGLSGPVRLLVHTRLPEGSLADVRFRLGGAQPPVEGEVQRTQSTARVGRSMRVPVTNDFPTTWIDARLPPGAGALTLDRLDGKPGEPLHVAVYPGWLTLGRFWSLTAVLLLAAAALQARGGGHAASAAGMALAFAHVARGQLTPDAPLTHALGALGMGVLLGAVGAGILTWMVRWVVRPVEAPGKRKDT